MMTYVGNSAITVQSTWAIWNNPIQFTAISNTSTSGIVWNAWNSDTVTGTAGTVAVQVLTDNAWGTWNVQFTATGNGRIVGVRPLRELSPEQRAAQEAAQRRVEEQTAEALRVQAVANDKAKKLLVEHLTADQQRTYEEKKYFDVDIEGRIYRIHHGSHGNVRLMGTGTKAGKEVTKFCIQPEGVPIGDVLLAQKLLLQCNEQEFLRIANATQLM